MHYELIYFIVLRFASYQFKFNKTCFRPNEKIHFLIRRKIIFNKNHCWSTCAFELDTHPELETTSRMLTNLLQCVDFQARQSEFEVRS